MTAPPMPKRKWLPVDAYRFLVLAALRERAAEGVSKRELAWLTRANHYMITRALAELAKVRHVVMDDQGEDGYRIRITPAGADFHERHRSYARETFGSTLDAHFRFGKRPEWSRL